MKVDITAKQAKFLKELLHMVLWDDLISDSGWDRESVYSLYEALKHENLNSRPVDEESDDI